MKNYKIEFRRSGHLYESAYSKTISGAVGIARKKGWYEDGTPESNWDGRPFCALIFERTSDGWERVATVNKDGIQAEDNQSRRSYKIAEERMAKARAYLEQTYATMMTFNAIADGELSKGSKLKS